LVAIYYMTNYAIKYDVSQYQVIIIATIIKKAMEDTGSASNPLDEQQQIR
jgi:hypothetical protein